MLVVSIPVYTFATASTVIAAALIIKGVSPETTLAFLLTGLPANIINLAAISKILGKKEALLYLVFLLVIGVLRGLVLLDALYFSLSISAAVTIGTATEVLPNWLILGATCFCCCSRHICSSNGSSG